MNIAFACAVFVAASSVASAASAQMAPVPGMPIPTVPAARGSASTGGIVEQGHGTVTLPADRLKIAAHLYAQQQTPGASSQPYAEAEKTVIDTMRANGIADARVGSPVFGNLNGGGSIYGTIEKPTSDRVAAIEQRVIGALPAPIAAAYRNVNISGALEVDDCSAALVRARALSYADARKRAEAFAQVASVRLGAPLNVTEYDVTNGCVNYGTQGGNSFGNQNDAVEKMTVDVSVNLTVTFAILP